jgi:hypothetical protein
MKFPGLMATNYTTDPSSIHIVHVSYTFLSACAVESSTILKSHFIELSPPLVPVNMISYSALLCMTHTLQFIFCYSRKENCYMLLEQATIG